MKKTSLIYAVMVVVALLLASGCATKNMSISDVYEPPQAPVVNEGEARKPYNYVVVPMNQILYYTGRYGIRHDMYVKEAGSAVDGLSSDNFIGFRWIKNGQPVIVIVDFDRKIDFNKKAYIGSRDKGGQYHQYSLDGKSVYGAFEERFAWDKLKSIQDTDGVEIFTDVQPGSNDDKFVVDAMVGITEKVKNLMVPGKYAAILKRLGVISSENIMLAVAFDFTSFFTFTGINLFPVFLDMIGITDPQGPHLENSPVTNYDLAKALAEKIIPLERAMQDRDSEVVKAYLESLQKYNAVLSDHEAILDRQKAILDSKQP